MLCVFRLKKGSEIPLHHHHAAQTGYVVSGKMLFKKEGGDEFTAEPGTGYAFSPNEKHGAIALEDSEIVEVFAPMRPEYV
jgi:quercetin dioxygenase-like cupin family protein